MDINLYKTLLVYGGIKFTTKHGKLSMDVYVSNNFSETTGNTDFMKMFTEHLWF